MLCLGLFSIVPSKSNPNLGAILSKLFMNRPLFPVHPHRLDDSIRTRRPTGTSLRDETAWSGLKCTTSPSFVETFRWNVFLGMGGTVETLGNPRVPIRDPEAQKKSLLPFHSGRFLNTLNGRDGYFTSFLSYRLRFSSYHKELVCALRSIDETVVDLDCPRFVPLSICFFGVVLGIGGGSHGLFSP